MKSLKRGAVFALACLIAFVVTNGALAQTDDSFAQHDDAPPDPAFAAAYAAVGDARNLVLDHDYDAARSIVAPLAAQGNPVAQNLLGIILEHADGDGASLLPALDAYGQAMAQGYGKAFYNAAMIYQDGGVDVPVDLAKMLQTYRDGADIGYAPVHEEWVWHLLSGDDTVVDHKTGFAQAVSGVEHHPENARLHTLLADAYYYDLGTPQSYAAARAAYMRSRDAGYAGALLKLGDMAYFGTGEPEDFVKAFDLLEQAIAADPNAEDGYYSLCFMVMYGEGVDVDYGQASQFLEQAIALGHADAVLEAILLYASPDFTGPHSDAVRAHAFCLHSADVVAVFADVQSHLSDPQKSRDRLIANAF